MEIDWGIDKQYVFALEYFVHDILYAHRITAVKRPALAFRFLDFPTQILNSRANDALVFEYGKKSRFLMEPANLRKELIERPFYVMLLDAHKDHVQILASCALKITCFINDNDFLKTEEKRIRRNTVMLFDNMRNRVGKVDLSLCISRESITPAGTTIQPKFIDTAEAGVVTSGDIEIGIPSPVKIVQNKATVIKENMIARSNATQTLPPPYQPPKPKREKKVEKEKKKMMTLGEMAKQCYCPPAMFYHKT